MQYINYEIGGPADKLEVATGPVPSPLAGEVNLLPPCAAPDLWPLAVGFEWNGLGLASGSPPPPPFGHAGNAWCLHPTLIADV